MDSLQSISVGPDVDVLAIEVVDTLEERMWDERARHQTEELRMNLWISQESRMEEAQDWPIYFYWLLLIYSYCLWMNHFSWEAGGICARKNPHKLVTPTCFNWLQPTPTRIDISTSICKTSSRWAIFPSFISFHPSVESVPSSTNRR